MRRAAACCLALGHVTAAAAPTAPAPPLPNILLLLPDQWRRDWTPLNTALNLSMPTLSRLQAQGTRFTHAFVPSPLCAPSRACTMSAREYDLAGVPDNFSVDYPITQQTYLQLLQARGYHTMVSGKDDLSKKSGVGAHGAFHAAALGWSDFADARCEGKQDAVNRGVPSEPYGRFLNDSGLWATLINDFKGCPSGGGAPPAYVCAPSGLPQSAYEDDYIAARAAALLARKPDGAPWFLQVGFAGPHPPFVVTPGMLQPVAGDVYPLPVGNDVITREAVEATRRAYAAELQHIDALFGYVLAAVPPAELANTYVVVSSDHGEMLGDWDDWGKEMPWMGSVNVPLVVSAPALGVPQGVAIADVPVATMDLAGTFLDWAGATPGVNMTSRSLRPFLQQPGAAAAAAAAPYRDFVSSGLAAWRAVVQSAADGAIYKLVCCRGACPGQPANATAGALARAARTVFVGGAPEDYPPLDGGDEGVRAVTSHAAAAATSGANHTLLYDVVADPYDTRPLQDAKPAVVAAMAQLLPAG